MIFLVSLPGVATADVRCKWLINGALGVEFTPSITQVGIGYEFRIDETPPANWEELYVYDTNDNSNYGRGKISTSDQSDKIDYISGIDLDGSGKVNVGKLNSASVIGTGISSDLWRGS